MSYLLESRNIFRRADFCPLLSKTASTHSKCMWGTYPPRKKKKGILTMQMVGLGAGSMVVLFTLPVVLNGFGRMCGEIWILAAAVILREPGTQLGSSWWPGRDHWEVTHELSIQFLLLKNFFLLELARVILLLPAKGSHHVSCLLEELGGREKQMWSGEKGEGALSPHFNPFRILCIYWNFCCRKTDSHRMNTAMLLAFR